MMDDGVSNIIIRGGDIYIRSEGDGVDSNGTLLMTGGTLVVDIGANGTSDCLAATGTLDLSNLSLALSDATALDETKIYTIATAAEVTGRFASEVLPKKWKVSVFPNKVSIAYANGTVMILR